MVKNGIRKVVIICVLLAGFVGFEHWKHRFDRPWAYSGDKTLLGKWEGTFTDPRGITKQVTMEILEPEEEAIDEDYVHRKYPVSREFKGYAQVKSKLGVEDDYIHGFLGTDDGHQVDRIDFMAKDESKHIRESFNVSNSVAGGIWEGDQIKVMLEFAYRTKTGSAFWNSADPIYDKTVLLTLHRVKAGD